MMQAIMVIENLVDDRRIIIFLKGRVMHAKITGTSKALFLSSADADEIYNFIEPYIHETAKYKYLDYYKQSK